MCFFYFFFFFFYLFALNFIEYLLSATNSVSAPSRRQVSERSLSHNYNIIILLLSYLIYFIFYLVILIYATLKKACI